jgi:hypothetical protein
VLARVLKIEIRVFPNVFECSRVLKIAIDAHEIIWLQSLRVTVTAEVAGSSLVVPAINQGKRMVYGTVTRLVETHEGAEGC